MMLSHKDLPGYTQKIQNFSWEICISAIPRFYCIMDPGHCREFWAGYCRVFRNRDVRPDGTNLASDGAGG